MEIFSGAFLLPFLGLLAVSVPFIIYLLRIRNQKKENLESFQEFTSARRLVLDKVQKWRNHYMLGLDLKQNLLVYCRFGAYPAQMTINLDEVDHTSIDEHYEEVVVGKSKVKKLAYLDILLHFKDRNKAAKSLTIYDDQQIRMVADEPFIAESWVSLLNNHLHADPSRTPLRVAM